VRRPEREQGGHQREQGGYQPLPRTPSTPPRRWSTTPALPVGWAVPHPAHR
jgi:hypothetical protein